MLSNAYFLAKIRFDTAENEPATNLQNFANFANPDRGGEVSSLEKQRRSLVRLGPEQLAALENDKAPLAGLQKKV